MPKRYIADVITYKLGESMYLMIPETILTSKKLTSDEKILLAYILTLQNAGKKCYAKPEYLQSLLGLPNVDVMFEALGERGFLIQTRDGREISPEKMYWLRKEAGI